MLYTSFGIDFEDGQSDIILNVAIDKAYNDATMQGAYNALKKENADSIKLEDIKSYISEEINDLLKKSQNYLDWHNNICSNLVTRFEKVTRIDGDPAFTYGNAQKWINMTMKYLYILSEIFNEYEKDCDFVKKYYKKIKDLDNEFQVPIDSYIIEAVWSNIEQKYGIPYEIDKLLKCKDNNGNRIPGAYSSEKYISWSNWNDTQYNNFQDIINENKEKPLDWEHREWIRIAKQRKI